MARGIHQPEVPASVGPDAAARGPLRIAGATAIISLLALSSALAFAFPGSPPTALSPELNLAWGDGHRRLAFDFRSRRRSYPSDVSVAEFPLPGARFGVEAAAEWPVVTLRARWSMSTAGWPGEHRGHALDLILLMACDAGAYAREYPGALKESKCDDPPEFLREAASPREYHLARALRGRHVDYEVVGRGGFGAADYTIRTQMWIGLSADERTVFFHDRPTRISDHLSSRHYLFMAHDAGDRILFEVHAVCVCAPRTLFQGEALRRVRVDGEYLITRMYERLRAAPAAGEIEKYLADVRRRGAGRVNDGK